MKSIAKWVCVVFAAINQVRKEGSIITTLDNSSTEFKIGKFARGEDYHKIITKKLKKIGKWINTKDPNCKWKICVDTSPLLEKAWAEEAGLGWIGKNSNLINQKFGSWLTLGFLILSEDY